MMQMTEQHSRSVINIIDHELHLQCEHKYN